MTPAVEIPKWLSDGMDKSPQILSISAGKESCAVFKVPASFMDGKKHSSPVDESYYFPQVVSVGRIHHKHRKGHLQMMEEHKYHYLNQLLNRRRLTLEYLFDSMKALERKAREFYSEDIPNYHNNDNHLVFVMLVDGCFVVELLRKVNNVLAFQEGDPIGSVSWILPAIRRDLILLENQLPFFIIQKLFKDTGGDQDLSIEHLSYRFLTGCKSPTIGEVKGKHLLDLLRTSYIRGISSPTSCDRTASSGEGFNLPPLPQLVPSLRKLRRSGIELSKSQVHHNEIPHPAREQNRSSDDNILQMYEMSFLDVKFVKRGVIELPKLTVDRFMALFLTNCVAYESFSKEKEFTAYIFLLDCLVKSEDEIRYLCNKDIIENYIGTDAELASFINILGKNVSIDVDNCYLTNIFGQIKSYQVSWNDRWRSCKYPLSMMLGSFSDAFFNTPWSFVSASSVFLLLFLTVLQTVFSILTYYNT